jgi:transposase
MAGKTRAISDALVSACKEGLKKVGPNSQYTRMLQAIIAAKEHGIKKVSEINNIARTTLMRWIKKVETGGVSALKLPPRGKSNKKFTTEQEQEIKACISKIGPTLTARKLIAEIKSRFSIETSMATAYRLFKKCGFSYKTLRPVHPKKKFRFI